MLNALLGAFNGHKMKMFFAKVYKMEYSALKMDSLVSTRLLNFVCIIHFLCVCVI